MKTRNNGQDNLGNHGQYACLDAAIQLQEAESIVGHLPRRVLARAAIGEIALTVAQNIDKIKMEPPSDFDEGSVD